MESDRELARAAIAANNGATRGGFPPAPPIEIVALDERANEGSEDVTTWCPTCRERAVPMRNGTCAFCDTQLVGGNGDANNSEEYSGSAPELTTVNGHDAVAMGSDKNTTPAEGALRLGDDLLLPLDAATQSLAILAVKGAGKSNAAAVLAEEMFDEGIPWVVVDPKGDWWGIRETVGDSRGLPVLVLGGPHGDLPLSAFSGREVSALIVERNLTCVLDVSWMDDDERPQFLADFGQDLFDRHHLSPSVRHLIVEEANEVLPQSGGTKDMKRAWTRIVCQGRQRGLGITLVSQRSALVNKNVLTQTGSLIVLRTTSPQDRAVIKGWVDFHSVSKEMIDSLPELANGEAWIVAPQWLGRVERVRLRRRWTFDSGATPELVGARRAQTLDSIDIEEIGKLLSGEADDVDEPPADEPDIEAADPQQAILDLLAAGPRRRGELLDPIDLNGRTGERLLADLRDRGLIQMLGSRGGARWALMNEHAYEAPAKAPEPAPMPPPAAVAARQLIGARRDAATALEALDEALEQPIEGLTILRARYLAALLARIEAGETDEALLDRFERAAGFTP